MKKTSKPHVVFIETSLTGAGLSTIEYCRKNAYQVTLICRSPDTMPPKITNGIDTLKINTTDHASLLSAVIELNYLKPIHAITTTNDFFVPEASLAAEQLGLPGFSYSSSLKARNKHLMRLTLRECGLDHLNPLFVLVKDLKQAKEEAVTIGYPLIAKLQNANDSIGVQKISSDDELERYFRAWQDIKNLSTGQLILEGILLESYIEGPEYSMESAQGFNQRRFVLGITAKEEFLGSNEGFFTELSLTFPEINDKNGEYICEIEKALDALNLNCGATHTEFRVNKDGKVKILEINPRLAGDMLGSHAIPISTGFDTAKAVVEIALGSEIDLNPFTPKSAVTIMGIHSKKEGIFKSINEAEIRRLAGVKELTVWTSPGTHIKPPESNADLIGRVAVEGKDRADAFLKAQMVYQSIDVEVC